MKIIQSFAQFNEGSYYLRDDELNGQKTYLNFYVMLLSVLTLQKYYDEVTMYCNQKAYDSFLKYLPYKHFEIHENKNDFTFWNYYKVDTIRKQTKKFIHVDPDVMIFDDLFSDFFQKGKYDAIVQDTIPEHSNPLKKDMKTIIDFLRRTESIDYRLYDGKAFSNGVVGMTIPLKEEFMKTADMFRDSYLKGELKINPDLISMASEELAFYLVAKKNKIKSLEVLPYDLTLNNGAREIKNKKKYTHMWGSSKFNPKYIKLIKLKTIKDFPEHKKTIEKYEKDVLSKLNKLEVSW